MDCHTEWCFAAPAGASLLGYFSALLMSLRQMRTRALPYGIGFASLILVRTPDYHQTDRRPDSDK